MPYVTPTLGQNASPYGFFVGKERYDDQDQMLTQLSEHVQVISHGYGEISVVAVMMSFLDNIQEVICKKGLKGFVSLKPETNGCTVWIIVGFGERFLFLPNQRACMEDLRRVIETERNA